MGALVGRAGVLPLAGRERQAPVLDGASAAERHRLAASGARAHRHHRGRARALQAHERLQRLLDARDRSCGDRHPDGGRARAAEERGQVAPRPGPRGVPPPRLAMEGAVGKPDRAAASRAGRFAGLGARAVHHGRAILARGARGVRPALPGRAALPRRAADQLVRQGRHGAQRSGSGPRRAREKRAVQVRLPARRRLGRDRGRDHAPGDDARRHRGRRASRRRAVQGDDRQERAPPDRRARVPRDRRRGAGRSEVRHRRREGDSRAQLRGLRIGQGPPSAIHQHPEPGRHAERECRTLPGPGSDRGARPVEGETGGAGPRPRQ